MSGGVDSSAAAAILKEQGFDVFGVFFHFWAEKTPDQIRENVCCSLAAEEDARRVAAKLGIKFYTLNLETDFKKLVVDEFINEYSLGRTPNPCVVCNRQIKFGAALEKVRVLGADYLATGHFARVEVDERGVAHLFKGRDEKKDQSYFLHQLTQEQLRQVLFPVGQLTKNEVRAIAKKFDLPTAGKRESQEVCFIPDGHLDKFLKKYIPMNRGSIFDFAAKKKIGEHDGLFHYTLGQRRGLGMSGGPWYVLKIDAEQNILWVARDLELLKSRVFKVEKVNWLAGAAPVKPFEADCRVRYATAEARATITPIGKTACKVEFAENQLAITPGQSAVFWDGDECLGGGVILA
jgi:tRNA-specific 2-thiouridylase